MVQYPMSSIESVMGSDIQPSFIAPKISHAHRIFSLDTLDPPAESSRQAQERYARLEQEATAAMEVWEDEEVEELEDAEGGNVEENRGL